MPTVPLHEIARLVGGELHGNADLAIAGVTGLEAAQAHHISFFLGARHREAAAKSRAGALLVQAREALPQAQVVVPNVRAALVRVAGMFHLGREREPEGIHPTAIVAGDATLGEGAGIGPFCRVGAGARIGARASIAERCSIGAGAEIGDGATLHPGVTIYPGCRVGRRVEIHTGAVIGVDGYSIALGDGVPEKIPSLGTVEIEDDVEIFANATIARAAFDRTVVGRHSKIDCLCHIAHNCVLGQGVILAGLGGLSGSVQVGDGAILAGGVGIVDHIKIGKGARVGAGSGIERDVADGEEVWGHPAKPARQEMRLQAILRKLPEAWRTISKLVKREGGEG